MSTSSADATRPDLLSSSAEMGPLQLPPAILVAAVAVASFHAAYEFPRLAFLMAVFCFCMVSLARVRSARVAFYLGLVIGMAIYAPQLWFFVGIFKTAAIGLWLIASVWIALFLLMSHLCLQRLPRPAVMLAIPILWTGCEYFRSELYYLRFAWVNVGFAFSGVPILLRAGVYGVGFFLMLTVAALQLFPSTARRTVGLLLFALLVRLVNLPQPTFTAESGPAIGPFIVGVQLEHAPERNIRQALDDGIARYPQADLLVLSEYTFFEPPPQAILDWCREHRKYLIVGGVSPLAPNSEQYRNTAFVVGPDGRIVFSQAKSVPIQFFTDGLPAEKQAVWDSPWGKIGLCICYDLSYSRVTDGLIRQGAQAIIAPTMDLLSWGEREHALHARVGPTRAAEYGVPIVRVCSSGVSQIIARDGTITATAPFPGQGEMLAGHITLPAEGRMPIDRISAPLCVIMTGLLAIGLAIQSVWKRMARS